MCTKGGLDPSWDDFGIEIVAQRVDFEGPGLNLGSIFVAFCPDSWAYFWGPHVTQGRLGSILGVLRVK